MYFNDVEVKIWVFFTFNEYYFHCFKKLRMSKIASNCVGVEEIGYGHDNELIKCVICNAEVHSLSVLASLVVYSPILSNWLCVYISIICCIIRVSTSDIFKHYILYA